MQNSLGQNPQKSPLQKNPPKPCTTPRFLAKNPQKLDLALLLYQPLISHFKMKILSETAGFRAEKWPFFVGGVKSAWKTHQK